jgi:PAS domain S-box-containing protein
MERFDKDNLLRNTIDNSMDMIQVFKAVRSENGEIIDFTWILNNKASEKIYGDVIGKSLLNLNPGVIKEGIFETFRRVVQTGQADQSIHHYVHEQFDGWYQQSTVKQGDGVATTTRDISELKKAELDQKHSRSRLQDIIDAPNIGIAVYKAIKNSKGEIINFIHESINRITKETLGLDFTGKLLSDHGEAASVQITKFIQSLQSGRQNDYIDQVEINGIQHWLSFSNSPIGPDRLVHTWQDITPLKRAQQENSESRSLVQTVFEVTLNPIAYHKALRDEQGNIIDFTFLLENRQARSYAMHDRTGQRYSDAYPGIKDTKVFQLYRQVVETGQPINTEVELTLKGVPRWFHLMAAKLEDGLVATAVDITDRKHAEQQIIDLKDEVAKKATLQYQMLREATNIRNQLLLEISDALRPLADPAQIEGEATGLLRHHLNAGWCYYNQFGDDQITATVLRDSAREGLPSMAGIHDLSDASLFVELMRSGKVMNEPDFKRCKLINDRLSEGYSKLKMLSVLAVPIVNAGQLLAVFLVADTQVREWTDDEVSLVKEVAERTWAAIEKAKAAQSVRESEEKYRTLFMSMDEGYLVAEPIFDIDNQVIDILFIEANRAAEEIAGRDFAGLRMAEIDPDYERYWYDLYGKVALTGEPVREIRYAKPHKRWFEFHLSRLAGPNRGRIAVLFQDITERKHREERQTFLLELSQSLQQISDPVIAPYQALKLLVNHMGLVRAAYYDIHEDQNTMILGASVETNKVSWPAEMQMSDYALDIAEAYRAGNCYVVEDAQTDPRLSEQGRLAIEYFGIRSLAGIPFIKAGKLRVVLGVHRQEPSAWSKQEMQLLEDFAERTWTAVERAKVEMALRQSQNRFQSIANLVPDLLWESEPDGSTEWYNQRWLEYTGQSFEQATGWDWVDAIHPQDRAASSRNYAKAVETGKPLNQEHRIRRHDGEYRWFVVNVNPVKDKKGKVIKMYGAATDIHGRRLAEEALQNSEEHLRNFNQLLEQQITQRTAELQQSRDSLQTIFDTTLVGMSVFAPVRDTKGKITDFRILMVNKKVQRSSGREDMVGKLYGDLFPDIRQIGLFDLMVSTIQSGQPGKMEYHYTFEGIDRWYSTMFVKGEDVLVSTNLDITERIQTEEMIKKMEQQQQLEVFRTSLTTLEEERHRISESLHNGIGQLLYGIKINMSTLKPNSPEEKFLPAKAYVNKLLTDAIVETRRISHELMPTTLEQFGLKSAIDDICLQLKGGTKFDCHLSGLNHKLEKYIELAIYRTIQELMTNVVKHAAATRCEVNIMIGVELAKIHVIDNGKGMPTRYDNADGIGLASIRSKVELLDGEVKITSTPGRGTQIEVVIPYRN